MEYALPGPALKCKQAMDEIERDMRPDPKAMKMASMAKAVGSLPISPFSTHSFDLSLISEVWPSCMHWI